MNRLDISAVSSSRRLALAEIIGKAATITIAGAITSCHSFSKSPRLTGNFLRLKGNINPSVCRSTCSNLSIEELCIFVKSMGFNCVDLVGMEDWPTLQKYGTNCAMCISNQMYNGWNHKQNHASLIQEYSILIPMVAQAGFKNLLCACGNRKGMNNELGLNNCADGIKKIIGLAEKNGIVLHMEMLNSKIDHTDYMCDKTAWGVELCKRIGSHSFKLLYDIYHMQVNEGDIIRTIKENAEYFGHYHTGGVPGRHEIDKNQELNYKAIMKAIVETGFKGHVAHEFTPLSGNAIASVKDAILICDV